MYRIDDEIVPPISVFEWLITFFTLLIPGINVVMLIFYSFAKGVNPSKANFSKALLIALCIGVPFYYFIVKPVSQIH